MTQSERQISGHTLLYAVIGDPVKHSLSPLLMNSAFAANQIDAVYVALTVKETAARLAMDMVRTFGLGGVNVTMPLKQAIIPWLDQLSPAAELVGARAAAQRLRRTSRMRSLASELTRTT